MNDDNLIDQLEMHARAWSAERHLARQNNDLLAPAPPPEHALTWIAAQRLRKCAEVISDETRKLQEVRDLRADEGREFNRLMGYAVKLEGALRALEAHHVEQNGIKGRDEGRSTTLRIIREALDPLNDPNHCGHLPGERRTALSKNTADTTCRRCGGSGDIEVCDQAEGPNAEPYTVGCPDCKGEGAVLGVGGAPAPHGAPSPLGGLGDVLAEYDAIMAKADLQDAEWDFVMRASDYRLLRIAIPTPTETQR